jgi:hypothetical protein
MGPDTFPMKGRDWSLGEINSEKQMNSCGCGKRCEPGSRLTALDQSRGSPMVDRKLYSRSRQKALLNRVVDEELYKPDRLHVPRAMDRGDAGDRGIVDLLMRGSGNSPGEHPRNRLADLLESDEFTTPEPERVLARRPGLLARMWRGLASLLPGVWS